MATAKTNDIDLRMLVVDALLFHGHPREAIRHEITLDSSSSDGRADIVVALDRELIGIEIKSGKDTLARLETQRDQYRRRFDQMCLVLDSRHLPKDQSEARRLRYQLRFGGVAVVERDETGGLRFQEDTFPDRLPWLPDQAWMRQYGATDWQSPNSMLSMLWAGEALHIAAELVTAGKVPPQGGGGQRYRIIPHLAEHASIGTLRPLIAQTLRQRELNKWEVAFWKKFDARLTDVDRIAS